MTIAISIQDAEHAVGQPTRTWPGKCYGIADALLESDLIEQGELRYGHFVGNVSDDCKLFPSSRPFHQHGWIELPDGTVVDPTRWVFEHVAPYIYVGDADDYDVGGNRWRYATRGPFPEFVETDKLFDLCNGDISDSLADFLMHLVGGVNPEEGARMQHGGDERLSFGQILWIANLPPEHLEPYTADLYRWLIARKAGGTIPFDNRCLILGAP